MRRRGRANRTGLGVPRHQVLEPRHRCPTALLGRTVLFGHAGAGARQFDGPGGARCRRIDRRGFRWNDGFRRGFFIPNQIRKRRALDGADPDSDPGVVAIERLDQRTLMLADPEGCLGYGAAVDAEGLSPELTFQLKEAALVAAQHQAMDREGAELRVGDIGRPF
ncbi:hypothetical protein [uncultured Paludibaculum sp.]|uniref:hypothetical protein n=1 Tax=uncultured Paludibaculum sp. TaxID=1765020 RepID=UPI002AAB0522|nr:hypothetical protein [uncultured Paludibaculum sp.]